MKLQASGHLAMHAMLKNSDLLTDLSVFNHMLLVNFVLTQNN